MTVSVVVPCRNEKAHIVPFMESLLAQDLDPRCELEILVADGMSDDGTREALRDYIRISKARIHIIDNPQRIVSTGLNAAILASTGEVIVRMDVHTVYAPDYIRESVRVLQETGADNVGGPWIAEGRGVMGRAIAAAFRSRFCNGGGRAHNARYEGEIDTVYLGCWRREAFERSGLFDPSLVRNQDDELNFRLRRMGGRVWQSPRIRSTYTPRASIEALFRQYMQYGFWKVAVMRKHGGLAAWRQAVPAVFVGSLILGIAGSIAAAITGFSTVAWTLAVLAGAEFGLYAIASVTATLSFTRTLPLRVLLLLPVVTAVYHVSYGLGFLMGLTSLAAGRKQTPADARLFTALTR